MRTKTVILCCTVALFTLLCGSSVLGQIIYGQPTSGNVGVVYTSWKASYPTGSDTTVSQFAMPFNGFVPIKDDLDVSIFMANASTSVDSDREYKMSGLSDVRIQGNHSFVDDQILLSLGISLPTGKKKLNDNERPALQQLSQNYLDFPVQRLGEGFGFNILLGGATMLGERIRGGAGLMYQYVGSYEPYEGWDKYNPGDLISANVGADFEGESSVVSVDAIYTMYTDDKTDDRRIFKQSGQLDMRLAAQSGNEKRTFSGLARYVMRGDNKRYDTTGLETPAIKLYGDEFSLGGGVSFVIGESMFIAPTVELRAIAGNGESLEDEIEGASVFGFGSSLGRRVGENINLTGGFKYFTGSANGGDIDLSGYQFTLGLSATM